MTREELNAKLDKLYAKSEEIKQKVASVKEDTKETLDDKLSDAKGNVAAARENIRETAERGKSKLGAEVLKFQMTVDKVKDDIQAAKDAHDQKRMAKLVDELDAYAADAIDFASYAMDEAACAVLEAADARADYEEQYGK